jgi:hypothetical protein
MSSADRVHPEERERLATCRRNFLIPCTGALALGMVVTRFNGKHPV